MCGKGHRGQRTGAGLTVQTNKQNIPSSYFGLYFGDVNTTMISPLVVCRQEITVLTFDQKSKNMTCHLWVKVSTKSERERERERE